jgi:hypothetical protein
LYLLPKDKENPYFYVRMGEETPGAKERWQSIMRQLCTSTQRSPKPAGCGIRQKWLSDGALYHTALGRNQRRWQKKDGPQGIGEANQSCVDHRYRELGGITGVAERFFYDQLRHWLPGVDRRTGVPHRPKENQPMNSILHREAVIQGYAPSCAVRREPETFC